MKKWIVLLGVVGLVVAGWWGLRTYGRVEMPWDAPQFDKVTRGDIAVPISASGLIEPKQRFEIKSEASGEVIGTPVQPGAYVRSGDVLVVLKQDDEQRNVDRTKAEVDRAEALVAQARISIRKAEATVEQLTGTVERLRADKRRLDYDLEKERGMAGELTSEQALLIAETSVASIDAQIKSAAAQLEAARQSVLEAQENVKLQEATLRSAKKTYEDALVRLEKCTIVSRHDAIVTSLDVRTSMLVQSGTSSFVGGTRVLELADISEKLVRVRIDEAEYGRIVAIAPVAALPDTPGLREAISAEAGNLARSGKVRITVDAFRDEVFEGEIRRVEPQGRNNVGSSIIQFDVLVTLTDAQAYKLPLGAQAQVEFTVDRAKDVLRVPNEAVKRLGDQSGVWVRAPHDNATQRHPRKFVACRFGITDGEFTEILGPANAPLGEEGQPAAAGRLAEGVEVFTKLPKADSDEAS